MRILIDIMSGDNAPLAMLKGSTEAAKVTDAAIVLVGDREVMERVAKENSVDISGFEIVHAPEVITMEDDPIASLRGKKDSSMMLGLKMLSEGEGDAFVSAGNTGALFTGATFIVKRAKGIKRAAIGTVLPAKKPCLLLDAGANITVSDEYLEQFAVLGSAYMSKMYDMTDPAVGLLNNGSEDGKGTPLQVEANKRLRECQAINYIGNVEANRVLSGECQVLVADGFTGNILLKALEGVGKTLMGALKEIYKKNLITKLSALGVKKYIGEVKKSFDPSEQGGSPILGISAPVIKAHGSSDAKAFKNAILAAGRYAESGVIEDISRKM